MKFVFLIILKALFWRMISVKIEEALCFNVLKRRAFISDIGYEIKITFILYVVIMAILALIFKSMIVVVVTAIESIVLLLTLRRLKK